MRRAFTLLELSCVIAVIAILAAATVPAYDLLVRRARTSEARMMIDAISHAELRHFRDRGAFLACGGDGAAPTGPAAFPADEPCWKELGIHAGGPVRYRYGVSVDGEAYRVTARGDLDRDGAPSSFTLDGASLVLTVQDELE